MPDQDTIQYSIVCVYVLTLHFQYSLYALMIPTTTHLHQNQTLYNIAFIKATIDTTPPMIKADAISLDAALVGLTFVAPNPRYHDPISVNLPALFRNEAFGPTLDALERKAPK